MNKQQARNLAAGITQEETDEMLRLFIDSVDSFNLLRDRLHFRADLVDYCTEAFRFASSDFYAGKSFEAGRYHYQLSEGIRLATSFIIGYLQGKANAERASYQEPSL